MLRFGRILEYQSREDAERAVKELDGRDLRGRPVRVALDDSVGPYDTCLDAFV
jgi:arginine/serine-rich splicing factor 4/5/6